MNYTATNNIIQKAISSGFTRFIIYPFGEDGLLAKMILKERYGIKDIIIVDNYLSKLNSDIISLDFIDSTITDTSAIILATKRKDLYENIINKPYKKQIFSIYDLSLMKKVGKYCYGDLLNDMDKISSIGSFCSFAPGTCVVFDHPSSYVTTSPFTYDYPWKELNPPKHSVYDFNQKVKIGNDIWLGRNVIITQGVTIGNGAIAGAGSIITKDVPDYAIVIGTPAKILRFRFTHKQIEALNRIKWWDWSVETIIKCTPLSRQIF